MINRPIVRIPLFILVFVLVLVLPWWLTSILLIALTIYFPFYAEVLFFGFLFDILYGSKNYALIIATVFLLATMFVKTRIRV